MKPRLEDHHHTWEETETGTVTDPSPRALKESEEDFGDALADSDSAGHEAPITGCTSIIRFAGTFHTGFFDFVAPSLFPSKIWITSDDRWRSSEIADDGGGEDGVRLVDTSNSFAPRRRWDHGDGTFRPVSEMVAMKKKLIGLIFFLGFLNLVRVRKGRIG